MAVQTLGKGDFHFQKQMGAEHASRSVHIVGGSAAGFYAAYLLARAGMSVTVLEQAERLEPMPRTLIVTSRMRDLLDTALRDTSVVVNEIRRFELYADGRVAEVSLSRPDLIVERSRLIRSLAEQAQHAGARIALGRRFLGLEPDGRGLLLHAQNNGHVEQQQTRVVVGADGAFSRVAEAAGWPRPQTVPLIQAVVHLPRDLSPDTVRVWFVPEDTPYFYWLIPESESHGVLGLIGPEGKYRGQQTRNCLEQFLQRRRLHPLSYQAARIPVYTGWVPVRRRLGEADVYLVGDAAAQVKVTTVGGLVTGFRGAAGVAEAILNGGRSRQLRALRRELDLHLLIRRALHRFTQNDYARLLDALNEATRAALGLYTRDEAGKLLWSLCRRQPRLLLWGLRALLANGSFPQRQGS
ncbi:MAG: NAD(P)/FAD-dependent oxidoreductase [Acidobacteriia bacterium]|nr:NAD(P)/FAD-dependent oxidoreductase [Terriglobia bacterium]